MQKQYKRIVCLINKSGTHGRLRELRKGLQIPMDGLMDWQTDGLDGLTDQPDRPMDGRRVQYLSEYVLRCKKGPLKIRGNIFKKSAKSFLKKKKSRSPMEKGRIEFENTFLEPGGNSKQNGDVQIYV